MGGLLILSIFLLLDRVCTPERQLTLRFLLNLVTSNIRFRTCCSRLYFNPKRSASVCNSTMLVHLSLFILYFATAVYIVEEDKICDRHPSLQLKIHIKTQMVIKFFFITLFILGEQFGSKGAIFRCPPAYIWIFSYTLKV